MKSIPQRNAFLRCLEQEAGYFADIVLLLLISKLENTSGLALCCSKLTLELELTVVKSVATTPPKLNWMNKKQCSLKCITAGILCTNFKIQDARVIDKTDRCSILRHPFSKTQKKAIRETG